MKKSELKNIIKQCIREVIFEEGSLTKIVAEVAQGMSIGQTTIQESKPIAPTGNNEVRQRIMQEVGGRPARQETDLEKKFKDMPFFAGTQPISENKNPQGDAGLDISNIPGMSQWGSVLSKIEKGKQMKGRRFNNRRKKKISGTIKVSIDDYGIKDTDSLVRRFNRKVRKEGVIEEIRNRRYFIPDSIRNAEKKRKRQRVIDKVNRKRQELLTFDDNSYKSKRRKK